MGGILTYLYLKEIGCNKAVSVAWIYIPLSVHMEIKKRSHDDHNVHSIPPVILYFVERYFRNKQVKMAYIFISGHGPSVLQCFYSRCYVHRYYGVHLSSGNWYQETDAI